MSPPWMPLYIADYLADTAHLSAAESGAYLHLIMHYWQRGKLPSEDRFLARIAHMSDAQWSRAKPIIAAFFAPGWIHKRIDSELEKALLKAKKRAEYGSLGGLSKALKSQEPHIAKASDLPELCQDFALASSSQPQSEKKESCPKQVRAKVSYSDQFEAFWKAYPTDKNMPKQEAWKVWQNLDEAARDKAIASLPAFRDYCKKHADHYRPVYADRYLRQRRFDGYVAEKIGAPHKPHVFVKVETPQWEAWRAWAKANGRAPFNPVNGGWYFDSEWPPGYAAPAAEEKRLL